MKINKRLHNLLIKTLKLSAVVPAISESIIILILLAFSYLNLWLPSTAVAQPRWSSAVTASGEDKDKVTKNVTVPVADGSEYYEQEGESCEPKTTSSFKGICCFNEKEKDKEKACKLTTPESGTTTEAICPDNYTTESDLCREGDKCQLAEEVILYSSITVKVVDPETSRKNWKVSEYMDALTCDKDENKTCSITSCARGSSFVIKVKDSVAEFVKWTWCKSTSGRSCTVECPKWGDTGSTVTATFEKKCIPNCSGKNCGADGCGGTCGSCQNNWICGSTGKCLGPCVSCTGKNCGGNGCGQSCGTCNTGQTCNAGKCSSTCIPNCPSNSCGDNGCGSKCGPCPYGQTCSSSGICAAPCVPKCFNKKCGMNSCGGYTCGTCPSGQQCTATGCSGGSGGGGGGATAKCCLGRTCTSVTLTAGQSCKTCSNGIDCQ